MSAKRALVVDDSRSARTFLARLLEGHQLEVDSVETAEQAIDYLTRHRPDVIFMDHLMPGMDGFQAVQTIKTNPDTATIPILMYTSQEGELYLGQARALGAMGVLPKQVGPADVHKVLQQLHLVDEAAVSAPAATQVQAPAAAEPAAAEPAVADGGQDGHVAFESTQVIAAGVDADTLRQELAELRRQMAGYIELQRERLVSELPRRLKEVLPELPPPPEPPRASPLPWVLAVAAGLLALLFAVLFWNEHRQVLALAARPVAATSPSPTPAQGRPSPAASPVTGVAPDVPPLSVWQVPFGEAPLAGARVVQLRALVATLAGAQQQGRLEVRRFAGRFCLAGDADNGFSLAQGSTGYDKCDLVADTESSELARAPAESVGFATLLAEIRRDHPQLRVQVLPVGTDVLQSYPDVSAAPMPTAGDWNAVAAANNRVEVRWFPET